MCVTRCSSSRSSGGTVVQEGGGRGRARVGSLELGGGRAEMLGKPSVVALAAPVLRRLPRRVA